MPYHNMKDDIVVLGISMMLMGIPIAGLDVNLYIAFGQMRCTYDNCIPKIRTVVTIAPSGIDHTD